MRKILLIVLSLLIVACGNPRSVTPSSVVPTANSDAINGKTAAPIEFINPYSLELNEEYKTTVLSEQVDLSGVAINQGSSAYPGQELVVDGVPTNMGKVRARLRSDDGTVDGYIFLRKHGEKSIGVVIPCIQGSLNNSREYSLNIYVRGVVSRTLRIQIYLLPPADPSADSVASDLINLVNRIDASCPELKRCSFVLKYFLDYKDNPYSLSKLFSAGDNNVLSPEELDITKRIISSSGLLQQLHDTSTELNQLLPPLVSQYRVASEYDSPWGDINGLLERIRLVENNSLDNRFYQLFVNSCGAVAAGYGVTATGAAFVGAGTLAIPGTIEVLGTIAFTASLISIFYKSLIPTNITGMNAKVSISSFVLQYQSCGVVKPVIARVESEGVELTPDLCLDLFCRAAPKSSGAIIARFGEKFRDITTRFFKAIPEIANASGVSAAEYEVYLDSVPKFRIFPVKAYFDVTSHTNLASSDPNVVAVRNDEYFDFYQPTGVGQAEITAYIYGIPGRSWCVNFPMKVCSFGNLSHLIELDNEVWEASAWAAGGLCGIDIQQRVDDKEYNAYPKFSCDGRELCYSSNAGMWGASSFASDYVPMGANVDVDFSIDHWEGSKLITHTQKFTLTLPKEGDPTEYSN